MTPKMRTLMWRRDWDGNSMEQATVRRDDSGIEIAGTVLLAEKGAPLRVEYRLQCDAGWITRRVEVSQDFEGATQSLTLLHDGTGNWRLNGAAAPDLAGCTDIDLGVSPSTNALPVNRLRPAIGETTEIRAAWVRFPEMIVTAAPQAYDRLAERRYRYRNLDSDFKAVLEVDEDGFPIDYESIWTRIADGAPARGLTHVLAAALFSSGPSPELGEAAKAFDWVIGGWRAEVFDYAEDGTARTGEGEWWFSWALEGRVIQDIWIAPPRGEREGGDLPVRDRYSTTLRWLDGDGETWRILWLNPVTGVLNRLSGRLTDGRIVLEGEEYGRPARWSFNDITPDSFVWRGESQQEDGSWRLDAEFRLLRITPR
jgi:uncharacterized protein